MADQSDELDYFGGLGQDLLGKYGIPSAAGQGLGAALRQGFQPSVPQVDTPSGPAQQLPASVPPQSIAGAIKYIHDLVQRHQNYLAACSLQPQVNSDTPQVGAIDPANKLDGTPEGIANAQSIVNGFDKMYGSTINKGKIDAQDNIARASKMSLPDFVDAVRTDGPWDYKQFLTKAPYNVGSDPAQRWGNANFGMTGAARGMPLWELVQGAGLYQTFAQNQSPRGGIADGAFNTQSLPDPRIPGAWKLPDADIRRLAAQGCQFGDNPGDTQEIINGYDYYHALQALRKD